MDDINETSEVQQQSSDPDLPDNRGISPHPPRRGDELLPQTPSEEKRCCYHCKLMQSKSLMGEDLIVEKVYGRLGPPPQQPRKTKFHPKRGKFGQGTNVFRERPEDDELEISNVNLLQKNNLITPKSVKKGDIILAARPFVHVLTTASRGRRCEACFEKRTLRCHCVCKYAAYCSPTCLNNDKDNHEDECFYIRKNKLNPTSDTLRFVMRFLFKMRNHGERVADLVPGLAKPRTFRDLLDHYDDINGSSRGALVQNYYEETLRFMGLEDAPDPDYFLECYGRMAINSFHILDEHQEAIGAALYLGPSVMDHSCVPNAAVSFEGTNMIVRSLIDRDEVDFSQVFISYIDLLDHKHHRREHLRKHYYFECLCDRCQDPDFERSMFCVSCFQCSNAIFIGFGESRDELTPERCSNCDYEIDEHFLEKYVEVCSMVWNKINTNQMSMDSAKLCLKLMVKSRFTPLHIYFIKTTEIAFESHLSLMEEPEFDVQENEELLETALFHGRNLLTGYSKYSQHHWSHEGAYLLKVAELEFVLGFNKDCTRHLQRAKEILTISLGKVAAATQLARIDTLLALL